VKAIVEQVYSSSRGIDLVKIATESADQNTPIIRLLHLMIDELLPELSNSLLRVCITPCCIESSMINSYVIQGTARAG